jgi:hypothetical protein
MLIGESVRCLCIAFDQAVLIETSCLSGRFPAIRHNRSLTSASMRETIARRRWPGIWNAHAALARRHGGERGQPIGARREPSKKPMQSESHHRTSIQNIRAALAIITTPLLFFVLIGSQLSINATYNCGIRQKR